MRSSRFIASVVSAAFLIVGGFAFVARSAGPTPAEGLPRRAGASPAKDAQHATATISKAQGAPKASALARAENGIPGTLGQSARPTKNGVPAVRTGRNDAEQFQGAATGTGLPIANKRGGLPGCYCGIDTEGRSFCFDDLDCPVVTACTSSSDCPSGYRCVADNCCTAPFDFGCFPECPNTLACSSGSNCAAGYNQCENDLCGDAVLLPVPGTAIGDTTGATVDSAPFCDTENIGPGVWYKVIGTGNTITASTCSEFNSNPDTKISVYCSGCSALECAAGNDDNCTPFSSLLSTVSWCARPGAEYLILVHDFSATSGSGGFTLNIWDDGAACINPPCAQICNATVPVDCGAIVDGDTSPSTSAIDGYNCVAWDESGPEIVYKFTPATDSRVTAALSNLPNDLDVFVLSDRCASNACIAYGDNVATFDATAGTTYFIAVDGFQGIEGTFTLTVTCEPLVQPGACCNDITGICTDGVDPAACQPPLLFTAGTLCSDLNPPCTLPGCGPTADGLTCEPVTCPTAGDACLSTVVSSLAGGQVRDCACIPDSACHVVMTPDVFPGVSCAGTCGTGNQCNLIGTDTDGDSVDDLFDCRCGPIACGQSPFPTCGGRCPVDSVCKGDTALSVCDCVPVACNQSDPATCGGVCPAGQECVSDPGAAACRCAPIGKACSQCGPGAHFIDACGPFPPVGTDLVANTGAVVGLDLNLDCIRDTSLVLKPCPAPNDLLQVDKTLGPIDDSANFPGTSPADGHPAGPGLDVIDTEIVSMCLTDGTVTLVAGAGGPSAMPLQPSLGTVAEDLATPDPTQADSFFDVFFEVSGAGIPGGPLYNQAPLPIKGRIDCLPPSANYVHPMGMCIPLTTLGNCIDTGDPCVSNRDCPGSSCGGTTVVANLVSASHSVNQPVCGDFGFPECFGNCPAGETCVTGVDSCTCEPIPCGQSQAPACDGQCPQGTVCTEDATGGFCTCRPTDCTPTADGTACQDALCSGLNETCAPKCVRFDPQTGTTTILDCACGDAAACHVAVAPPVRAGNPCVVPDNGTGTITLPPAGCDYLSPNEVHEIIDGLPPGTTIELSAIHQDFICGDSSSRFCSLPLPPGQCENNGGSLGGKGDCFESTLALTLNGTGALAGFQRSLSVPVLCEVHTAPRTPGNAVQTFPTEMARLAGELIGDPDFCTLKVSGGRGFGLPSPGQTTLTRLSSGEFSVDSFFDITYQIDFVGCPGSVLDGLSGSTTATIRMRTNSRTLPSCEGSCPAGEICEQSTTLNPDGTYSVCCNCIPEPRVACCLLDSTCRDTRPDVCLELGGNPQRPGTTCAGFECPAVEIDTFESSIGDVELEDTSSGFREVIAVNGPATAHVFFEGAVEGSANDDDGDSFDEVVTEMVQLELTGTSSLFGPVAIHLHPTIRSMGEIEETANSTAGTLDLPPFTPTGTARSFFDLFFQIDLPDIGIQLFTQDPKRMSATIANKPPGPGAVYENLDRIRLYDAAGNATPYFLVAGHHRPNPGVPCGQSDPATCGGFCATGEVCVSVPGAAVCRCVPAECPPGEVVFVLPPNGFTDPAQPHPIYEPGVRQGIKEFLVQAPDNADILGCWSLCETAAGGTNSIVDIQKLPPTQPLPPPIARDYIITLDHPLQPGAVTTLTYKGAATATATGIFKALPGDVSANGKTDAGDLKALIDCLNSGTCRPPECDIDRKGRCTGADIEREIDLLNGGGEYDSWDQATLVNDCDCPGGCVPGR